MLKVMNGKAPKYMEVIKKKKLTSLLLRDNENNLAVPFPKIDSFKHSFSYSGAIL